MAGYSSLPMTYMENRERRLCYVRRSSSGCWELVGQDQGGEAHKERVVVLISCEPPDSEEELNEAFFKQLEKNLLS